MTLPSIRITFLLLFLGCTGLILIGLYMQYGMGLYPCPLCITQRIFIISCGLTGLTAFIVNPQRIGRRIYGSIGIILAIAGGSFSGRQLWLQSLPEDQAPACGPALEYLLANFPLMDALSVLLRGDGNCAKVTWTLFNVSIAGWTLVAFLGIASFNAWQILRKR